MSFMTREQTKVLLDQLEKDVLTFAHGAGNKHALREVESLCTQLIPPATGNGYALEKLAQIRIWSKILYSPRRHRKFPGGSQGVRITVLGKISSLRSALGL